MCSLFSPASSLRLRLVSRMAFTLGASTNSNSNLPTGSDPTLENWNTEIEWPLTTFHSLKFGHKKSFESDLNLFYSLQKTRTYGSGKWVKSRSGQIDTDLSYMKHSSQFFLNSVYKFIIMFDIRQIFWHCIMLYWVAGTQ
jgi:hypothetical protein